MILLGRVCYIRCMLQGAAYRILFCFLRTDTWSFAELCKQAGYPTDLGGYYLRQLVRNGYLESAERGQYTITPKGRGQLAIGHDKQIFVTRPRFIVLIVATQAGQYAVLRRTKQPFIGVAEWPASALDLGETMPDAAARVAQERFGDVPVPVLVGLFRRTDRYGVEVFDDKLFAVHSLDIPKSVTIKRQNAMGNIELHAAEDMPHIYRPSRSLLDIYAYVDDAPAAPYVEHEYALLPSDFSSDNDS